MTEIEYVESKFSKSRNIDEEGSKTWWPRDTKKWELSTSLINNL